MKKLLILLLYIPSLSSGQFNSIDQFQPDLLCPGNEDHQPYYYPYQDLGLYTNSGFDLLISDWVDFGYAPVFTPDSVYVDAPFIGVANGSINYSNQRLDNWNTNITTFLGPVDYTVSSQYLPSSQVEQYNMFYISPLMGNSGIRDQFTYTNGGLLEFKKRFDFFNSNNIFDKEFTYDLSTNQLNTINYYTNGLNYRTDVLTYSNNGFLDNVDISDGRKYEYHYNSISGYCEKIVLFYNNIFVDTVCEYTFVNGLLQGYELRSYVCNGSIASLELEESYLYTYDSYGRIWTEEWYEEDGTLGHTLEFFYFNTPTGIDELGTNKKTNKQLIKVTDILGREIKNTSHLLLYLFDDGTVEKRIVIE